MYPKKADMADIESGVLSIFGSKKQEKQNEQ